MAKIKKVLVIGYSTRYIACSGKRAGYDMYSIDHFDDIDLRRCSDVFLLGENIPSEKEIQDYIDDLKIEFDAIILGSGVERAKLSGLILNNKNEVMWHVTDKSWLSDKLKRLNILHPKTYKSISDISNNTRFPLIAKPIFGAGGIENFLITNEGELPKKDSYIFQEYISGIPASVSLISSKYEAVAIAVNEQLIGKRWLGQKCPFGYCGNITPFKTKFEKTMCEIAKNLILELGLIGSNGVDFIVTDDEVYVIEINPRFQSTLDTVELSCGINIFDAHVRAFEGDLGDLVDKKEPKRFSSKAILYAENEFVLKKDLDKNGIVDISPIGRVIPEGDPIATAIGVGGSRGEAIFSTLEKVLFIKNASSGSM